MRELFPEFLQPTNAEFKRIWKEAIFVFDTSVLLSLYDLPENARVKLIEVLNKLGDRVWIPHQVGLEFYRGRLRVIHKKEESHKYILGLVKGLEEEVGKHFDSETFNSKVRKLLKSLEKEINTAKTTHCDWGKKDTIEIELEKIFKGKIGSAYSDKDLSKIYEDGRDRYAKEIPPGFKDKDKDEKDKTGTKKYGDLVLWMQILDKAKSLKKPIVLVTNEAKGDWWWKLNSTEIVGPRFELKKECQKITGDTFHLYQSDEFVKHAPKYLDVSDVDHSIIDQIKKLKESSQGYRDTAKLAQGDSFLSTESLGGTVVAVESQVKDQESPADNVTGENEEGVSVEEKKTL